MIGEPTLGADHDGERFVRTERRDRGSTIRVREPARTGRCRCQPAVEGNQWPQRRRPGGAALLQRICYPPLHPIQVSRLEPGRDRETALGLQRDDPGRPQRRGLVEQLAEAFAVTGTEGEEGGRRRGLMLQRPEPERQLLPAPLQHPAATRPCPIHRLDRLTGRGAAHPEEKPFVTVARQEVFFGVTTNGGYPATQVLSAGPGLPLPPGFIDQSNSVDPADGGTVMVRRGELMRAEAARGVSVGVRGSSFKPVSVTLDLKALARTLEGKVADVVCNGFLLAFRAERYEVTLFPDGRALVRGTTDPGEARAVYARYIGN